MKATFIIAAIFLLLLLAFGCGEQAATDDPAFPEFVYRSEESLDGYRLAAANQELFDRVPCYCGCKTDPEKYQSLKDCFYDRNTGGFDEHAAGCTTCLDEAMDIGQWRIEGFSPTEIRNKIDEKYSERGEPTDTPMP
ncbi:MAG: PCYCGC motif-containing (lipo)protein [Thermoleophilia bacterium]|nr:PCYCGC motif-containing (lipo)protein [Thermoleophilia bacterium]